MTSVTLTNLSKSYDGLAPAVHGLTLTAQSGRIMALLGPSGCGKTTILKLIAGLLAPDAGEIAFDGRSVHAIPTEKRGAVMVFQNHLLFPGMSVADNVGFGLRMRGVEKRTRRKRIEEMLALVRLAGLGARRPHELSGGQQQRVALARALIVEPAVLLLDEPLSNLDAHLRDEMRDLIFTIQRQLDITTVFVTHDQEEAVILGDEIALIFDGRLQQVGPPDDFYERPASPAVARFFGGVNFIHGDKRGARLETPLGALQVCPVVNRHAPNGAVVATIRPENVQLQCEPGANSVAGRIQRAVYAGTHVRYRVEVGTAVAPFEVIGDPASRRHFQVDQAVHVCLPPEKIWLMAAPSAVQ